MSAWANGTGLLVSALVGFTLILVSETFHWPLALVTGLGCPFLYLVGFFMGRADESAERERDVKKG